MFNKVGKNTMVQAIGCDINSGGGASCKAVENLVRSLTCRALQKIFSYLLGFNKSPIRRSWLGFKPSPSIREIYFSLPRTCPGPHISSPIRRRWLEFEPSPSIREIYFSLPRTCPGPHISSPIRRRWLEFEPSPSIRELYFS
ncbi:hypothetical protein RRG08_004294 [Elysia crispata]|uniref:Uncharacterized protein n=1 Tax=Elysia crispata TaxID=231223 RepID=A0AAE0YCT9_9GAST|nr:hypothetical protein RRG08_004294 [Elysia crispata]